MGLGSRLFSSHSGVNHTGHASATRDAMHPFICYHLTFDLDVWLSITDLSSNLSNLQKNTLIDNAR